MNSNELISAFDTKFRGQQRVLLGKLTSTIKHGETIPAGTFVVMASGDRKLRVKILEKDVPHKGFSVPLPLNRLAEDSKVTPRYLLWFFSHPFVCEYLLEHTTGSVFLRVPKRVLESLPVPIPKGATKLEAAKELILERDDEFAKQLSFFYDDYLLNVNNGRFRTAIILAGAIAEMLVYQSLIEQGVDKKLLTGDRNLGLGKMLTYLQLLRLDKTVPLNHLRDIQSKRNEAVHAGRMAGAKTQFVKEDLECFDNIIKHYGI